MGTAISGRTVRDNLNSSTHSLLNFSRSLELEKTKKKESDQTSTLDWCYRTKTAGSVLNSDRSRYYQSREDAVNGDRMAKPSAEVRLHICNKFHIVGSRNLGRGSCRSYYRSPSEYWINLFSTPLIV